MIKYSMNTQRIGFFVIFIATAVLGIGTENIRVGLASFVPICYAFSNGLGVPYDSDKRTLVGFISVLSFCLLTSSVAISTPSSDVFDTAWFGYISASAQYAIAMVSAPGPGNDWKSLIHRVFAYITLIVAIAFSCGVAIQIFEHENDTAIGLAVVGAILSVALDGWVTASWFFGAETKRELYRGRIFGISFILALSSMFGTLIVTATFTIFAALLTVLSEYQDQSNPHTRTLLVIIRFSTVVLAVVSLILESHVIGLSAAGSTSVLSLVTLLTMLNGEKESLSLNEPL